MNQICIYCGKEINNEELVACEKCNSYYHKDCWNINHKCLKCNFLTYKYVYKIDIDDSYIEINLDDDNNGSSTNISEKICPFCQSEISQNDNVVVCKKCNIPHHRDCWIDNNGCATYGCGSKEYLGVSNNSSQNNNSVPPVYAENNNSNLPPVYESRSSNNLPPKY